mgnify:CR=1 FL=1
MLMVDLLRKGPVSSQEDLAGALSRWGETVTQATVSRDLAAIGAVRGPEGYRRPEAMLDPARVNVALRPVRLETAKTGEDYCWMWTNKTASPVALSVKLSRGGS